MKATFDVDVAGLALRCQGRLARTQPSHMINGSEFYFITGLFTTLPELRFVGFFVNYALPFLPLFDGQTAL